MQCLRLQTFLKSSPLDKADKNLQVIKKKAQLVFLIESLDILCRANEFTNAVMKYEENPQHLPSGTLTSTWCKSCSFLWEQHLNLAEELQLSTIHFMVLRFFSYNQVNYAQYPPSYWLEMVKLPITSPECYTEHNIQGKRTVQRQWILFNYMWPGNWTSLQ